MKEEKLYDKLYQRNGYYWGKKPSAMCDRLLDALKPDADTPPRLLDLGCGEGRNSVYLAKHGFRVTGLDYSLNGLRKALKYAKESGVPLEIIHADIKDCQLKAGWDVIFSSGTLHYLPPETREERFGHLRDVTVVGGLNVITVFVKKPFIPKAPDGEAEAFGFRSGELMGYYWDWEILYCLEEIFDCQSGNVPHKHAVNRIIARKTPS